MSVIQSISSGGYVPQLGTPEQQPRSLSVKNTNSVHIKFNLNPSQINETLNKYFAQPAANESGTPIGFGDLSYGSKSLSEMSFSTAKPIEDAYNAGFVPTPPEAGKLIEAGIGNMMNPEWLAQVSQAAERNGGLGDSENGFLAWSKDGFIRLRNPNLTPEQNRKLAAMSLQTGTPVHILPSRTSDVSFEKENVNKWVETIIGRHEKELSAFINDPKDGYSVADGRTRIKMELNNEVGRVVSYNFKLRGGFAGFVQKNLKGIFQATGIIGTIGKFIPGWGWIAAGAAKLVEWGAAAIATGKANGKLLAQKALEFGSSLVFR
ncbi:MAG: hypothetical protein KDD55_12780 [Bdellovibrionales bacterium]|nr:hypothetical protein [Bdellovibrionales bacterium]